MVGNGKPVDIGGVYRAAALTVDPAGAGLFSSLPDLLTFTHVVRHQHTLLATPERMALRRAVSAPLTAKDLVLDHRFVIHGHGGTAPGAQTIVAYDREHDTTVAVWCNRLDPGADDLLPSVVAAKQLPRAPREPLNHHDADESWRTRFPGVKGAAMRVATRVIVALTLVFGGSMAFAADTRHISGRRGVTSRNGSARQ